MGHRSGKWCVYRCFHLHRFNNKQSLTFDHMLTLLNGNRNNFSSHWGTDLILIGRFGQLMLQAGTLLMSVADLNFLFLPINGKVQRLHSTGVRFANGV